MKNNYKVSISLWTLTVKEIRRFLRIWVQTLVPPAVTMSLYFVIFGSLIGPRIGSMDGFDYIQYMIPGLIMLSVITNSYNNVVSSFYSVKFQKSIEELLISPMPNWAILLGFVLGKFYDYEAKYNPKAKTEHIIPVKLDQKRMKKVTETALKAHKVVGCKGVTRSDFKYYDGKFYLLEINTQPGMTKLSLVPEIAIFYGKSFIKLIEWILKDASIDR